VDERNSLLLTAECHNKQDILNFPFIVSNLFRISRLKSCIYILGKMLLILIMLFIILQLGGLGNLISGILSALTGDTVRGELGKGKFDLWYQRRNSDVTVKSLRKSEEF
jgi:hypothetical protein